MITHKRIRNMKKGIEVLETPSRVHDYAEDIREFRDAIEEVRRAMIGSLIQAFGLPGCFLEEREGDSGGRN